MAAFGVLVFHAAMAAALSAPGGGDLGAIGRVSAPLALAAAGIGYALVERPFLGRSSLSPDLRHRRYDRTLSVER